jgi:hypothetical protein
VVASEAKPVTPPARPAFARSDSGEKGFLVYFFTGEQDPSEIVVFRKICLKYGLQAWDEMEPYLP